MKTERKCLQCARMFREAADHAPGCSNFVPRPGTRDQFYTCDRCGVLTPKGTTHMSCSPKTTMRPPPCHYCKSSATVATACHACGSLVSTCQTCDPTDEETRCPDIFHLDDGSVAESGKELLAKRGR